jgi:hypothetical protein
LITRNLVATLTVGNSPFRTVYDLGKAAKTNPIHISTMDNYLSLNPTKKFFIYDHPYFYGYYMSQPTYLLETNDFIMKKKIFSLREHYDFEDLTGTKIGEADGNLFQVLPNSTLSIPTDWR